jgi:FMNH2-dependent dimethyl sulfone monooxygenase
MPIHLGIWCPVDSGFLRSHIDQGMCGTFKYAQETAQIADAVGLEYILVATRYISEGWPRSNVLEAVTTTTGLLVTTKNIRVITAFHPGLWNPMVTAKIGTILDHLSQGRWHLNLVSGWFETEFRMYGGEWLEHDERYRRSEEFIKIVKEMWISEDDFLPTFKGDFYETASVSLQPKPVQKPYPSVFQGGNL